MTIKSPLDYIFVVFSQYNFLTFSVAYKSRPVIGCNMYLSRFTNHLISIIYSKFKQCGVYQLTTSNGTFLFSELTTYQYYFVQTDSNDNFTMFFNNKLHYIVFNAIKWQIIQYLSKFINEHYCRNVKLLGSSNGRQFAIKMQKFV
jgi:hypothetical protein